MLIERCIFKRILNDTNFRTWFHLIKNRYNRSLSSFTQLNVAFFGSDRFSSHILEHLYQLTTSGKKINRLEIVTSSSQKNMVQHCAIKHNINTHLWPNIDLLKGFDIGILASFGHLLPRKVIEAFPLGIVNIHPSLLPRWRGSSPLAYTIAAGDKIGGVSLMDIRPKHFDIGPVLLQKEINLSHDITLSQLLTLTANTGCELLDQFLEDPLYYRDNAEQQATTGITYAHKLNKYAFYIDWHHQSVVDIDRLYRAFHELADLRTLFNGKPVRLRFISHVDKLSNLKLPPDNDVSPGTAVYNKTTNTIYIRCMDGWVGFEKFIRRKPMSAKDFYNGYLSKVKPFIFESQKNPIFDHIDKRRIPDECV